jgi:hypothetical protein
LTEVYFREPASTAFNNLSFARIDTFIATGTIVCKAVLRFTPRRANNMSFTTAKQVAAALVDTLSHYFSNRLYDLLQLILALATAKNC